MPYYEYRCRSCGRELEALQRITDDPLKACPSCGGMLSKLISNTSFVLKGTGWYVTDYARKTPEKRESKPAKDETKTESSKPQASSEKAD